MDLIATKDSLRSIRWKILPAATMDSLANPSLFAVLLIAHPPRLGPLQNQRALELCRSRQHMQEKTGSRVPLIRVGVLTHRDEPDATFFKFLDVIQATNQRTPKAIQFPSCHTVEFV